MSTVEPNQFLPDLTLKCDFFHELNDPNKTLSNQLAYLDIHVKKTYFVNPQFKNIYDVFEKNRLIAENINYSFDKAIVYTVISNFALYLNAIRVYKVGSIALNKPISIIFLCAYGCLFYNQLIRARDCWRKMQVADEVLKINKNLVSSENNEMTFNQEIPLKYIKATSNGFEYKSMKTSSFKGALDVLEFNNYYIKNYENDRRFGFRVLCISSFASGIFASLLYKRGLNFFPSIFDKALLVTAFAGPALLAYTIHKMDVNIKKGLEVIEENKKTLQLS